MKGWKTVTFGVLLGLIAVFSNTDMQAWISQYVPEIGGLIGTAIIILRALTTSTVFKKGA